MTTPTTAPAVCNHAETRTNGMTKPLSDIARQVAEAYAVVYPEAPARSKIMQWLNRQRKAATGASGIKSHEMSAAIAELVEAGILHPGVEASRGVAARGPSAYWGNITRLCESAVARGFAFGILDELDQAVYAYRPRLPDDYPEHLEQHVRLAVISDQFEHLADTDLPMDVWAWMTEPQAEPHLAQLPEIHRRRACQFGMNHLSHNLRPIDTFAQTCERLLPDGSHNIALARARIFQGKLDDAESLLDAVIPGDQKHAHIEIVSQRALMAFMRGDDASALQHVQAVIELERSGTRKRIIYPDNSTFTLSLPALIRLGTTQARALFDELLAARKKLKLRSDLDGWLFAAAQADDPHAGTVNLYNGGHINIGDAVLSMASLWNKKYRYPVDHPLVIEWLEDLIHTAHANQYHWIVAEVQLVLAAHISSTDKLAKDTQAWLSTYNAEKQHASFGTSTLTHLVTQIEPWEYALRDLEKLVTPVRKKEPTAKSAQNTATHRLVWQILVHERYEQLEVTPLQQNLGKTGRWTKGRRVALKRLLEEPEQFDFLTQQDLSACRTIRRDISYGWNGESARYHTDTSTAFKLIGHPLVIDENGDALEVSEEPPRLTLTRTENRLHLQMLPHCYGRSYGSFHDEENARLWVTHFSKEQQHISELLPPDGLSVPIESSERVESLLKTLGTSIAVEGSHDHGQTAQHKGDPAPLLILEPAGDSLRVRLCVEPLANTGKYFDAGLGAPLVYVQTGTSTTPVARDIATESTLVDDLIGQSVVLRNHYDGRSSFVLEETTDALELLDEAQTLGFNCIWPADIPVRIRHRATLSDVRLDLHSAKDWFSATGELQTEEDAISLEVLMSLMKAKPESRFVELGKGDFLALSNTLKQQLDTLQAFSKPAPKGDETSQVHPLAIVALEPLLSEAKVKANTSWSTLAARTRKALESEPSLPSELQAELRTYQREGYAWLARLGAIGAGACLADDMGLGKTVQTLAVLLSRADAGPALVVAPTSVLGNWQQEAQRFAPTLNVLPYAESGSQRKTLLEDLSSYEVVVISYGLLVNDFEHLAKVNWSTLVLDEAQAIKNAATRRARCAQSLTADFRIALTGTPVQNSLMDLHSLFTFLNPGLLGSQNAFRQRFGLPISRDDNEHVRQQLQQVVAPFLLRRHKRDVLSELPARTEITLDVSLSTEERALYEVMREEALAALQDTEDSQNSGQNKITILSHLTRLRRLCCNPSLVKPDWSGSMSKLAVFTDTLQELIAGGHKALVFSQFVDHLKIVERTLKKESIAYQYLDGSTSAKKRTERVQAFQAGEGDVFLISLTAGGTGLNLTAADYVIHLDPWWNPAVEDQASDRAHRLGQQRPVTIVRMVTTNTIEQQIQELHRSKRDLADSVLAGADNASLDAEALMQLLQAST